MRIKSLIASLFALVIFAGISSAQHVRAFDGIGFTLLAPASPTSAPYKSPNISSFAGQTVRIRIEAADASTASLMMGFPESSNVCTPTSLFNRPAAGSAIAGIVIAATTDNNAAEYLVPTDLAWKGTCRIMSVRLRDGSEHIGRIFFK